MDLKELELIDPEQHWYYQSKLFAINENIKNLLIRPLSVVDVGAGSGFFAKSIYKYELGDSADCIDPNYQFESTQIDSGIRYLKSPDQQSLRKADLFLFIDVLEHVENDWALLNSYLKEAKSGALVVITVPAFMSLWSNHDVFLEHFKRYKIEEVLQLCRDSNLTVLHKQYLFGAIFPIAWIFRRSQLNQQKKSDMRKLPKFLNSALLYLEKLEHSFKWNKFFGLSAMVIAKVN